MTKHKSNIEIIVEETAGFIKKLNGLEDRYRSSESSKYFDEMKQIRHDFATTLLSKLNIPEEGEVIAEGEVREGCPREVGIFDLCNKQDLFATLYGNRFKKLEGKKGRLIFIEDKEIK